MLPFYVYIIIGLIFSTLLFGSAIWALNWSAKNGQFRNLEKGSKVIFDDEEPEGQQTDYFPSKRKRKS